MRIWLIQRAESTPHDDNGQRRLMRMGILAELMQKEGHEVIWWTSTFDHLTHSHRHLKSTRKKVKERYHIHYLKGFGYKSNRSPSRFIDNNYVAREFTKEATLDNNRPDVILSSLPSVELCLAAVKYANRNKIPIFIDIRDLWPDLFKALVPPHLGWLVEIATLPMRAKLIRTCKNATGISGITEKFVEWGLNHAKRPSNERDKHFPMAYITHELDPNLLDTARQFWDQLGVSSENGYLNILFLGTFTNSFEFAPIFEAAKILAAKNMPVNFIFCGVGAKEESIKNSCEKLDNCVFAGWVNTPQIQTILKLCSIGLAPYIETANFTDNVPNKPAEYMSEGLAIATSLSKGVLKNLIENENCGFSYGGDGEFLANQICELVEHPDQLKLLNQSAKQVFDTYYNGNKTYLSMIAHLKRYSKEMRNPKLIEVPT